MLGAVFLAALALRLAVDAELGGTALFRSPQLDAFEFLTWAKRIAAGDAHLPPYPTHGLPYPYFLAALLRVFGGSLIAVRAAQAVLGALTCVLIARAAGRIWGSRAAAATAGLLTAAYGPLVLIDSFLWEEGLLLFFAALFFALVARLRGRSPVGGWGMAGLALGLAVAVRPTMLVLLPLGLGVLLRPAWRERSRQRAAVVFVVGVALVVAPIAVAVSRSAGAPLFLRGFGAINAWIGNDPVGGGVQNARLGGAWDRLEAEAARAGFEKTAGVEGYYTRKTLRRALADPLGLARAVASKALWLTQAEEPRDNHSYYFFREQSRVLRLLPGFGLLAAFAAVGMVGMARARRLPPWLLVSLLLLALPVLAALMGMRYRIPMVLPGALLAAPAPGVLFAAWSDRRRRAAAGYLALALLTLAATHLRHHAPSHRFGEEWALSGDSELLLGQPEAAERAFRRAIELAPESGLGWDGLGRLQRHQARLDEAERSFREAIARDPDALIPHVHLAELLLDRGELDEAVAQFRAVLKVNPIFQPVLERLAEVLGSHGRLAEARELWTTLARARGRDAEAWLRVAQLAGALGEPAAGIEAARNATQLEPRRPDAWQLLGFLSFAAADAGAARAALDGLRAAGGDLAQGPGALLDAAVASMDRDYARADAILRRILERTPGQSEARALLLRNAEAAGRRAEAESFLAALPPGSAR